MDNIKKYILNITNYLKSHRLIAIIFIVILFSCNLTYKVYLFNFKYKNIENNTRIDVDVQRIEKITEDKVSYLVKYENNKFILNIYSNKYSSNKNIDISKYSIYKYGDVLTLRGKINIPEKLGNPYEFNYKKYLNSKNIVGEITTYEVRLKNIKIKNPILKLLYNLKYEVSKNIKKLMPEEEFNLFKSMLYGEDNDLDESIKENFTKCGLSHLLAVSGSNIASLMLVLNYILKKLNKKNNTLVIVIVICIFCIFCSFELSIIRASIMIVISMIFVKKEKKINTYLKILISYILIIIYNPFYIFNIGLLMSYLAICGIVTYQQTIFSLFDIKIKKIMKISYVKPQGIKKVFYYILYIIFLSFSFTISSQIFLLPIQIYYFNSFNIISLISNLIIAYLDNVFAILGFSLVLLSYFPYLSNMLANCCFLILRMFIIITNTLSSLDVLNLKLQTPTMLSVIFYYIIVICITFKKYIIYKFKRKRQVVVKRVINFLLFSMIFYIPISYIYLKYFDNYIIYFNVEQGNMAIIHNSNQNIVVDMGSTKENLSSNILINYLEKKNIACIDAVILTHFHTDHINGLNEKLLKSINVKKVIYTPPKEKTEEYKNLLNTLQNNNITKVEVQEGEKIEFKYATFNFICPNVNKKIEDEDIPNANSLVSILTIRNRNYMFMGDATKNTEEYILKNNNYKNSNIEVLQVGHHGSKTSTCDEFLRAYNIKKAIISSKKKVYNHPSEDTLKLLSSHNIDIKITEINGAVKINI